MSQNPKCLPLSWHSVELGKPPSLLSFLPSFNLVFIEHLLYAKHCSRLLFPTYYFTQSPHKTPEKSSSLPIEFSSSPAFQVHGVTVYSLFWYCVWFFSPPRPTSKQQPILYRISGSSFLLPCLYLLFVTGLLLLVSLMPGYHSNTWVSWYHCMHPKLYVIPIVCIISPELPSVTLKDLCLSHPTTY